MLMVFRGSGHEGGTPWWHSGFIKSSRETWVSLLMFPSYPVVPPLCCDAAQRPSPDASDWFLGFPAWHCESLCLLCIWYPGSGVVWQQHKWTKTLLHIFTRPCLSWPGGQHHSVHCLCSFVIQFLTRFNQREAPQGAREQERAVSSRLWLWLLEAFPTCWHSSYGAPLSQGYSSLRFQ
jgi:hypothetical protein